MEQLHTCSISNNISQSYDASSQTCSLGRLDLSNGDSGTEISLMVGLQSSLDRGRQLLMSKTTMGGFDAYELCHRLGGKLYEPRNRGDLLRLAQFFPTPPGGASPSNAIRQCSLRLCSTDPSTTHLWLGGRPGQALPRFLLRLLA